jgi:hypothetical protein
MRILDSAPVASPSTCTPRRVSCRACSTCVRKRSPFRGVEATREPRAARHYPGLRLRLRGVRGPSSRSLHQHFTSSATRQHVPAVLGADGSAHGTPRPPRTRKTCTHCARRIFETESRQACPLGATAHLLSKTGHRAARSSVPPKSPRAELKKPNLSRTKDVVV